MFRFLSSHHGEVIQPDAAPVPMSRPLDAPTTFFHGGWRPSLPMHMHQLSQFLAEGTLVLPQDGSILKDMRHALRLASVGREIGYMEYIHMQSQLGITLRYYEDGLYVASMVNQDVHHAQEQLTYYVQQVFEPLLHQLFSGTQLPVNDAKHTRPVVAYIQQSPESFSFGAQYGRLQSRVSTDKLAVYTTVDMEYIVAGYQQSTFIQDILDMHIFMRAFTNLTTESLLIQAPIQREVERLLQAPAISQRRLNQLRPSMAQYQHQAVTALGDLSLIEGFIPRRLEIIQQLELEHMLLLFFQQRVNQLQQSIDFSKVAWTTTSHLLEQTHTIFQNIHRRAIYKKLAVIQIILLVGLVAGTFSWLQMGKLAITDFGIVALCSIFIITLLLQWIIGYFEHRKAYRLNAPSQPTRK